MSCWSSHTYCSPLIFTYRSFPTFLFFKLETLWRRYFYEHVMCACTMPNEPKSGTVLTGPTRQTGPAPMLMYCCTYGAWHVCYMRTYYVSSTQYIHCNGPFTNYDIIGVVFWNRIHYSMYRIELAMTCSVCHSDLTMVGTYIRAEVGLN